MRSVIKYFIILCAVIVAANYVYIKSGLYEKDIKKCDGEFIFTIDSLSEVKEILYFAESSNFTTAKGDSSLESISEILNRKLLENNIGTINQAASHAGTYKKLIYRLKNKKVKTLIITMNLRSFGINWIESKLETNLSRTNIIYSGYPPLFKKFLLSFKGYDHKESFQRDRIVKRHYKDDILFEQKGKFKSIRDWDSHMFSEGHKTKEGIRDAEKCELSSHFIKNYAFIIKENNPRVQDFDDIINFCRTNRIKVVLNLLSENYIKAKELCGEDLYALMKLNASFLTERYKNKTLFINNLTLLKDSNFIDRLWPTEHYNYEGRNKIASNIANQIQNGSTE
ncbi:MAG: hypothetical protein H0W84_07365 [Bacteroidetes bacterium]|nr:hypothetical protein [Bacteroidota bacterium]